MQKMKKICKKSHFEKARATMATGAAASGTLTHLLERRNDCGIQGVGLAFLLKMEKFQETLTG